MESISVALPINVEDLIPHRDRMKLIDEVVEITSDEALTRTTVTSRWPLVKLTKENGADGLCVDPVVFIEIVAQTAAVQVSARTKQNAADRRGWMVGIKKADFFADLVPVDTVLTTRVRCLQSIDNYDVLEGEVSSGGVLLCRIEIQVFRE
jgi:predicted hotdog family 3-hydroxylacyl-ACP dehydratase